jgi:hypothetical protein
LPLPFSFDTPARTVGVGLEHVGYTP